MIKLTRFFATSAASILALALSGSPLHAAGDTPKATAQWSDDDDTGYSEPGDAGSGYDQFQGGFADEPWSPRQRQGFDQFQAGPLDPSFQGNFESNSFGDGLPCQTYRGRYLGGYQGDSWNGMGNRSMYGRVAPSSSFSDDDMVSSGAPWGTQYEGARFERVPYGNPSLGTSNYGNLGNPNPYYGRSTWGGSNPGYTPYLNRQNGRDFRPSYGPAYLPAYPNQQPAFAPSMNYSSPAISVPGNALQGNSVPGYPSQNYPAQYPGQSPSQSWGAQGPSSPYGSMNRQLNSTYGPVAPYYQQPNYQPSNSMTQPQPSPFYP